MKRRLRKGDIVTVEDCPSARKNGHVGAIGEVMGAYRGTWQVRLRMRTVPTNYYHDELVWLGATT